MTKDLKYLTQYNTIGITGIIGCGKSFLAHYLCSLYEANIIEIDDIRRNMLWSSLSAESVNLRKALIKEFYIQDYDCQFFFDRESFTDFIFSDIQILKNFNSICQSYFKKTIKKNLLPNRLNCIVWVNLIEDNYVDMIEHIVYVDISHKRWSDFNKENLIIQKRLNFQLDCEKKKNLLDHLSVSYEVFYNE